MGDRGNIIIPDQYDPEKQVYLYTHWRGSELPQIVALALGRGRGRWDDGQYLARILFCELVPRSEWDGETGYGISVARRGGGVDITVDVAKQQVVDEHGNTYSFEDFVASQLASA